MKSLISTLLLFNCIFTFAQVNIDGHKGIYDSRTKTYLISVPKFYQISNFPQVQRLLILFFLYQKMHYKLLNKNLS